MEEKIIGPRTSHEEFFKQKIDLRRPEFEGISEAVECGDIAKADKIFADAMRKNPQAEKLAEVWRNEVAACSDRLKDITVQRAKDAMEYKVIS
ncbi:MAG: hypothetical protein IKB34_09400, partial [Clostridia bacterium]|nr:hypothetical protein [Clostridia bacterium]